MNIEILKFGGSSLASAEELRKVADVLLARRAQQRVVVCSAMGGVTNDLINIGLKATRGDEGFRIAISELEKRHLHVARELGIFNDEVGNDEVGNDEGTNGNSELPNELQVRLNELKALCDGLYLIGEFECKEHGPVGVIWRTHGGSFGRGLAKVEWIECASHRCSRLDQD